jgi:hypothetical protein
MEFIAAVLVTVFVLAVVARLAIGIFVGSVYELADDISRALGRPCGRHRLPKGYKK